ncbi:hypothetical protein [Paenibacillus solani]|uniref:hypothetical protein n=1 Tax=Paenibacillus solani TaxID=1705565 RepID=UPI003D2A29EA
MEVLNQEIADYLISVLQNTTSIQEFESWLYDNEERLEKELGIETYFMLVNLNYKSKFVLDELEPVLIKILDYRSIYEFEIRDTLKRLFSSEEDFINCCRKIYDAYCKGYSFLRIIALKFIVFDYDLQLDEPEKMDSFIKQYRQELIEEGKRIFGFFETNKIEIVGPYEYIDSRNNEEKIEEQYWT